MRRERCKECRAPKPSLAIEQGDDFCSTGCARRHYGTSCGERRSQCPSPKARHAQLLSRRALLATSFWRGTSRLSNSRNR